MKKVFRLAGIIILAIMLGILVINSYESDTETMAGSTKVGVILNVTSLTATGVSLTMKAWKKRLKD